MKKNGELRLLRTRKGFQVILIAAVFALSFVPVELFAASHWADEQMEGTEDSVISRLDLMAEGGWFLRSEQPQGFLAGVNAGVAIGLPSSFYFRPNVSALFEFGNYGDIERERKGGGRRNIRFIQGRPATILIDLPLGWEYNSGDGAIGVDGGLLFAAQNRFSDTIERDLVTKAIEAQRTPKFLRKASFAHLRAGVHFSLHLSETTVLVGNVKYAIPFDAFSSFETESERKVYEGNMLLASIGVRFG